MSESSQPVVAERLSLRHVGLIALLAVVVMFEGFDISLTSVVLPYLGEEYGVSSERLGEALAVIALGSIAAWFLIRLADRFGRRPILILAAAGFSLGSLATVLTGSVAGYTAIQFVARLLMVTQIAVAYLLISETIPPQLRGRANGILGACGSFGAALPFLALEPALASSMGWRLLFVIGAAPLLVLPLLFIYLPETPVWKQARQRAEPRLTAMAEFRSLIGSELRSRFLTMSALWFIINFATSVSALFFTLYVVQERGWAPGDFARLAPLGLGGAFLGYLAVGFLMDAIGRRLTVTLFMIMLGGLTQLCYSAEGYWVIAASFVGLQAMLGVWVAAYTLNSELFPTRLRGAANGWCHNLIGRWGVVLAPWILGAMTAPMGGIGPAATLLGFVAYLAIPLVWVALPETRGRSLETEG
ncbi:MFS transporter [Pacificimonas sp. ICDLI1SI03]